MPGFEGVAANLDFCGGGFEGGGAVVFVAHFAGAVFRGVVFALLGGTAFFDGKQRAVVIGIQFEDEVTAASGRCAVNAVAEVGVGDVAPGDVVGAFIDAAERFAVFDGNGDETHAVAKDAGDGGGALYGVGGGKRGAAQGEQGSRACGLDEDLSAGGHGVLRLVSRRRV